VEGRMAIVRQAVGELLIHQRCLEGALYKTNGGLVSTWSCHDECDVPETSGQAL
jgi:hypothetical protein